MNLLNINYVFRKITAAEYYILAVLIKIHHVKRISFYVQMIFSKFSDYVRLGQRGTFEPRVQRTSLMIVRVKKSFGNHLVIFQSNSILEKMIHVRLKSDMFTLNRLEFADWRRLKTTTSIKWRASSWWPFRPTSAWGSREDDYRIDASHFMTSKHRI